MTSPLNYTHLGERTYQGDNGLAPNTRSDVEDPVSAPQPAFDPTYDRHWFHCSLSLALFIKNGTNSGPVSKKFTNTLHVKVLVSNGKEEFQTTFGLIQMRSFSSDIKPVTSIRLGKPRGCALLRSGLDPDSIRSVDTDKDSESGFGSRRTKNDPKK
jgi:hypothetical protein